MTLLIIIAPAAPATAPSRRRSFCPPRLLFCLGGDSQTFLLPRLLLRRVRPLNVKPDTVLPSLLPTADTDSASWSWSPDTGRAVDSGLWRRLVESSLASPVTSPC